VTLASQQTRSPTLSSLDWSPVIYRTPSIQTAPTCSRQTAKLFASAGKDSRCLRWEQALLPKF
jgi:hypothetical protein